MPAKEIQYLRDLCARLGVPTPIIEEQPNGMVVKMPVDPDDDTATYRVVVEFDSDDVEERLSVCERVVGQWLLILGQRPMMFEYVSGLIAEVVGCYESDRPTLWARIAVDQRVSSDLVYALEAKGTQTVAVLFDETAEFADGAKARFALLGQDGGGYVPLVYLETANEQGNVMLDVSVCDLDFDGQTFAWETADLDCKYILAIETVYDQEENEEGKQAKSEVRMEKDPEGESSTEEGEQKG